MQVKVNKTVRKTSGFSLTELLVVIAIVAILAAIIFPVFSRVQENTRQSTSISNMHDISSKLEQYRLDNHTYPDYLFGYAYYTLKGAPNTVDPYHQTFDYTKPIPMDQAFAKAQQDADSIAVAVGLGGSFDKAQYIAQWFGGLYPEYIKNVSSFTDPNNPNEAGDGAVPVGVNILCGTGSVDESCYNQTQASPAPNYGALVVPSWLFQGSGTGDPLHNAPLPGGQSTVGKPDSHAYFYKADAYDASPEVKKNPSGAVDFVTSATPNKYTWVARYQSSWTMITQTGSGAPTLAPSLLKAYSPPGSTQSSLDAYTRQLRWRNPPSNTYVTSTTWHVPNAGVILTLWQGGNVKKLDYDTYVNSATVYGNTDVADVSVVNGQTSPASFWQVLPQ